jgi:hypothetical protein
VQPFQNKHMTEKQFYRVSHNLEKELILQSRLLYGEKTRVRCDHTNNTEEDIKNNRVVAHIFPPIKNIKIDIDIGI